MKPKVKLVDHWATLTSRPIDTLRVKQSDATGFAMDAGLAEDYWFSPSGPGRVAEMLVGMGFIPPVQTQSREDWWPVFLEGKQVAELRDDAVGYVLHTEIDTAYV